jgi:hypothetical protein
MQSRDEGSTRAPFVKASDIERFITKIEPRTFVFQCWLWKRPNKDGYGRFWWNGSKTTAHRFAFLAYGGKLAKGEEPDHLCRVRRCVNPDHLQAVTRRENLRRGNTFVARNLAMSACKYGHPYSKENTYTYRGYRRCRECNRLYQRRLRVRRCAA